MQRSTVTVDFRSSSTPPSPCPLTQIFSLRPSPLPRDVGRSHPQCATRHQRHPPSPLHRVPLPSRTSPSCSIGIYAREGGTKGDPGSGRPTRCVTKMNHSFCCGSFSLFPLPSTPLTTPFPKNEERYDAKIMKYYTDGRRANQPADRRRSAPPSSEGCGRVRSYSEETGEEGGVTSGGARNFRGTQKVGNPSCTSWKTSYDIRRSSFSPLTPSLPPC